MADNKPVAKNSSKAGKNRIETKVRTAVQKPKPKVDMRIRRPGENDVEIWIYSKEPNETWPVDVGINGYFFSIPRDEWVPVPNAVVCALENSAVLTYVRTGIKPGMSVPPQERGGISEPIGDWVERMVDRYQWKTRPLQEEDESELEEAQA